MTILSYNVVYKDGHKAVTKDFTTIKNNPDVLSYEKVFRYFDIDDYKKLDEEGKVKDTF